MSLARDTLANWIGQFATLTVTMASGIVLSRFLGPERLGVYLSLSVVSLFIISMTNLGAQAAATYFFSDPRASFARTHTLTVWMLIVVLCVEAVAGGLLKGLMAMGVIERGRFFAELPGQLLLVVIAMLPFSLYQFSGLGILTGLGRLTTLARFSFYLSFTQNILNVVVMRFAPWDIDVRLRALIGIWIAGQISGALMLMFLLGRGQRLWERLAPNEIVREVAAMARYGFTAFYGNFAGMLINRFDQITMLQVYGPSVYGVYSRGKSLAKTLYQPSGALQRAGFSRVRAGTPADAARLVRELVRANFLLLFPVIAVLMLIAPWLIVTLYGSEYAGAAPVLQVLLPGVGMSAMSRMLALYFTAHEGRPQISSNATWLGALVTLFLIWLLGFKLKVGMLGVAAAVLAGNVALLGVLWGLFAHTSGLWNPFGYLAPRREDWTRLKTVAWDMLKRGGV